MRWLLLFCLLLKAVAAGTARRQRHQQTDFTPGGDAVGAIVDALLWIIGGEEGRVAIPMAGNFNATHSAQVRNAVNLLILCAIPALVSAYREIWQRHRPGAVPTAEVVKGQ